MNQSPEHQPRSHEPGPSLIDLLVEKAPNLCAVERLRRLAAKHGGAATAFLSLPDVDPYRESVVDDFTEAFLGDYPDRETLIDSELEALGWDEKLKHMIACHDIPEGMLTWSWPEIWKVIAEQYDIVEQGGRIYVFSQ